LSANKVVMLCLLNCIAENFQVTMATCWPALLSVMKWRWRMAIWSWSPH